MNNSIARRVTLTIKITRTYAIVLVRWTRQIDKSISITHTTRIVKYNSAI